MPTRVLPKPALKKTRNGCGRRAGNEGKGTGSSCKSYRSGGTSTFASAEAFRSGNLGIMDYYKFQNIKADTEMRKYFKRN